MYNIINPNYTTINNIIKSNQSLWSFDFTYKDGIRGFTLDFEQNLAQFPAGQNILKVINKTNLINMLHVFKIKIKTITTWLTHNVLVTLLLTLNIFTTKLT